MVPGNKYLVFMRQAGEPMVKTFNLFDHAGDGRVARVNKDLTVGYIDLVRAVVRIGEANDTRHYSILKYFASGW